jgi:nicotinate-nucleotide pyrophosphorylase (carboxylating)
MTDVQPLVPPPPPAEGVHFEHLLPPNWRQKVQLWLDEDLPSFDIGGFVVGEKEETAVLYGKSDGLLAGRCFFDEVFRLVRCILTAVL